MAENEPQILKQARLQGLARPEAGMKVPEGYFDAFAARMAETLPYRAEAEEAVTPEQVRTTWQKIRPYVYMAAMFAGIWLMLQMFGFMSRPAELVPMDENPVLAEAFSDDDFIFNYYFDDISYMDMYEQFSDDEMLDCPVIFEEDPLEHQEL